MVAPAAPAPQVAHEFGLPETLGEKAVARANVDGKLRELRPNQLGAFERVPAQAATPVPVQVSYPEGQPDEEVSVSVQDGGSVGGKNAPVELVRLDPQRQIAFEFTPGTADDLYHVSVRKGTDLKTIEVWVGPELKLAE